MVCNSLASASQADAATQGALASFDQTMLIALQETETALNAYAKNTDWKTPMEGASIGRRPKISARVRRSPPERCTCRTGPTASG